MLNQVSKALSGFFKPLASSKSDADSDPSGSTFERYTKDSEQQNGESKNPDEKNSTEQAEAQAVPISDELKSAGNVIPFPNPQAQKDAQKKAIGISQAWLGLKDLVKGSSSQPTSAGYDQASSQASSGHLSKKGAILDKKRAKL